MGDPKFISVAKFSRMMGISRGAIYDAIHGNHLPIAHFCGSPVKPFRVDLEKALALFSSSLENVVPITQARSLKTEKVNESVNHRKLVTKEDLWA